MDQCLGCSYSCAELCSDLQNADQLLSSDNCCETVSRDASQKIESQLKDDFSGALLGIGAASCQDVSNEMHGKESTTMADKTILGAYLEGLTRQLNGKPLHVQPVYGDSFVMTASRIEQGGEILSGTLSTMNTHGIIPISQIVHVWYNPEDLKSS